MRKENEVALQKQKQLFEEMISKLDEINSKSTKLQKSKNVKEIQKFKPVIEKQKTIEEFTEYTLSVFHECKTDESDMKTYFGCFEKMQKAKLYFSEKIC